MRCGEAQHEEEDTTCPTRDPGPSIAKHQCSESLLQGGSGCESSTTTREVTCITLGFSEPSGTVRGRGLLLRSREPGSWSQHPRAIIKVQFLHPALPQIKNESFLEDINNILNSGDIPNLYNMDEQDQIITTMRPYIQEQGLQPTKANLMAAYTGRVRSNIHMVLCMRCGRPSQPHGTVVGAGERPGPARHATGPRLLCPGVLARTAQGCQITLGPGFLGGAGEGASVSGPHLSPRPPAPLERSSELA